MKLGPTMLAISVLLGACVHDFEDENDVQAPPDDRAVTPTNEPDPPRSDASVCPAHNPEVHHTDMGNPRSSSGVIRCINRTILRPAARACGPRFDVPPGTGFQLRFKINTQTGEIFEDPIVVLREGVPIRGPLERCLRQAIMRVGTYPIEDPNRGGLEFRLALEM